MRVFGIDWLPNSKELLVNSQIFVDLIIFWLESIRIFQIFYLEVHIVMRFYKSFHFLFKIFTFQWFYWHRFER